MRLREGLQSVIHFILIARHIAEDWVGWLSMQQNLYFLPDLQGHGSLRPIFGVVRMLWE